MIFHETDLSGVFVIDPFVADDRRGRFVKTFQLDKFAARGLETRFEEEFYSVSRKGVLRGLHFQLPPDDCVKLVYCTAGAAMDVAVDLRVGSPTFGKHAVFHLNADTPKLVYIPSGFAHGFYVVSESATLMYSVSRAFSPKCDSGILWNSAGIAWPDPDPILSDRDLKLTPLSQFNSPFIYPKASS